MFCLFLPFFLIFSYVVNSFVLPVGCLDSFQDLYHLNQYREEILALDGFGEKSYERLWSAITRSRENDSVHFLVAMDIPKAVHPSPICRFFNLVDVPTSCYVKRKSNKL